MLDFNNKGQVAQILVQEHSYVPVECYVEKSPSKRIKMLNENVPVHKIDACSG